MRLEVDSLKPWAKKSKWIIVASIFFIVWKFFLIDIELGNGLDNPRFNDASVYIAHIESIRNCPTIIFCKSFIKSFDGYFGFEHLTYRIFFGTLAIISEISSHEMFIQSFYIGIVLFLPVLILFLKRLNSNTDLIAFSIFFLALYNGAGSYHGFFWVVPSFFALLLFLLVFSVFITENVRHWRLFLTILVPSMIYTHFIGLYFIIVLIFYSIFHGIFKGKIDIPLIRKLGFIILITALFYIPTAFHLKDSPYGGNSYGVETFLKPVIKTAAHYIKNQNQINNPSQKIGEQHNSSILPGFAQIKTDYLDWVFPHWTAVLIFFFLLFILFFYKQHILLSLFFSSLSFTLLSSVSIYGIRSLLLTWPLTFLICAHGTWFVFRFLKDSIKNRSLLWLSYSVVSLSVILFIVANIIYSYSWSHGSAVSIKEIIRNL